MSSEIDTHPIRSRTYCWLSLSVVIRGGFFPDWSVSGVGEKGEESERGMRAARVEDVIVRAEGAHLTWRAGYRDCTDSSGHSGCLGEKVGPPRSRRAGP